MKQCLTLSPEDQCPDEDGDQSHAGPMVKPSVSLLPPSSLQLSEGSSSLLCLLSDYSPQGALPSWTMDGVKVKDVVLTSTEDQKNGVYSRSSTLTLSKERWEEAEVFGCIVSHHDTTQITSFRKSRCEVH
ncbi:immunoglobulin lambda-1 light chain-like isoform X2 [Silurus meridionalis]|nr:immunoglobulin lambda-1 light chain-like isoform X2 [Silurus meridionalis]